MAILNGGKGFEDLLKGKRVAIDISQWVTRARSMAANFPRDKYTEEEIKKHPVWMLFLRIKNYVTRCGASFVLGVFDCTKANEGKIVRGIILSWLGF